MEMYIKCKDTEQKTTFEIPIKWQVRDVLRVNATSLKNAIDWVLGLDYELPEGEFLPDTFEIDYDRLES